MKNRIIRKNAPAPTLEIDPEAEAVYIRFSRAKVARTIAEHPPRRGAVVTTDVDARNNLVGVEIVGVKEFSIKRFGTHYPRITRRLILKGRGLCPLHL